MEVIYTARFDDEQYDVSLHNITNYLDCIF